MQQCLLDSVLARLPSVLTEPYRYCVASSVWPIAHGENPWHRLWGPLHCPVNPFQCMGVESTPFLRNSEVATECRLAMKRDRTAAIGLLLLPSCTLRESQLCGLEGRVARCTRHTLRLHLNRFDKGSRSRTREQQAKRSAVDKNAHLCHGPTYSVHFW